MKEFSNRYIFIFSSVMVIVVAILLSLAATLLQPRQEKNLEIEKKKSMLESIKIPATLRIQKNCTISILRKALSSIQTVKRLKELMLLQLI